MNVFDMIAAFRLKRGDYKTSDEELLGRVRDGDAQAFYIAREQAPDEVQAALATTYRGSISSVRPYVVLPGQIWSDPVAEIADNLGQMHQCMTFPLKDETSVAISATFRPAAILSRGKVTFYPYEPLSSGTRAVRVSYIREPRPILYLTGLIGKIEESAYGATRDLNRAEFTFPPDRPALTENELRGATLSVFWNENLRRDYTIEENADGALSSVFHSQDFTAVEWVDRNFQAVYGESTSFKDRQYRMTISRTSDLPERFHNLIVDFALGAGGERK